MSSVASPSSTDEPRSSASPDAPRRKSRRFQRLVVAGVTVLVGLMLFLVILTQGHVSGEEFSPTHFQQRRFSFYEIPLLHLQITPIRRTGTTSNTARYVRQSGMIPTPKGPPSTWHLVSISRGLTGTTPDDAQLLIDQLELDGQNADHWRDWSRQHKPEAKVLWQEIAKLANRELYLLMPPIFELAQQGDSAAQLQQRIDRRLQREYRELILDMRAADRSTLADQLLTEALQDYPQDPSLQKLKQTAKESPSSGKKQADEIPQ